VPEIQELLERTTPTPPPDFDVADLARRGRGRRRRAQVGTGLGAVALLAAAVAGIGALAPGGDQDQVVASRPPTGALAEAFAASGVPLGTWEQVAEPPFSPRMGSFTGTASDGRVVVWGGSPSADGGGAEGGGVLTDGGVYDTESGAWEAIPAAPLPDGGSFHWTQLNDDRLMVLMFHDTDRLVGAVYDLRAGTWTTIEAPPGIRLPVEGIAWSGKTLALIRLTPGEGTSGSSVQRWSLDSETWTSGAPAPLSSRLNPATAFDGSRLAIWGGANGEGFRGEGLLDDGAIYDLTADRWSALPAGPLPPTFAATAVWFGDRLVVAGGQVDADPADVGDTSSGMVVDPDGSPGSMLSTSVLAAAYDVERQNWTSLPPVEDSSLVEPSSDPFDFVAGRRALLQASGSSQSGAPPKMVYDEVTQSWLPAPLPDIHTIDGTLVATSRTRGDPGDEPFEVQVQAGSVWEPAAEAPFVNRMDAGVAASGQDLLVVGGAEGPDLEITGDAWLLRFDARH
jgi:hypothetical protein